MYFLYYFLIKKDQYLINTGAEWYCNFKAVFNRLKNAGQDKLCRRRASPLKCVYMENLHPSQARSRLVNSEIPPWGAGSTKRHARTGHCVTGTWTPFKCSSRAPSPMQTRSIISVPEL